MNYNSLRYNFSLLIYLRPSIAYYYKLYSIHHEQNIAYPILLCTTPLSSHAQKIQQPHIVLILCDDMGFSDLGCYGSEIHTPNIDKLAQDGIRFSQFKIREEVVRAEPPYLPADTNTKWEWDGWQKWMSTVRDTEDK